MAEVEIGTVTEFVALPAVAGIELAQPLNVGDLIQIKGHTTGVELMVESMQADNRAVTGASVGQTIGIKISERVRGEIRFIR